MLPGKTYKPEDFLRILRKRMWVVIVPWAFVAAGTAGFARMLPDLYRAQALIQYTPASVLESPTAPRSSASNLQDRLRATQEGILTRTRLERLIVEFKLYQEEQKTQVMEEIVSAMRRDITATPTKGDVLRVTYQGRNPVTVKNVTERLASYFIDESQKDSTRRAEGTSAWVEAGVDEKLKQLREIEGRIAAYKIQHAGEMPSLLGANVQAVATIQNQLQSLSSSITQDTYRVRELERRIEDTENQVAPSGPPIPAPDPAAMNGTAAQNYNIAKQQLNNLIARGVKPTHMDYQKWERLMKTYEKEMNEQALTTPVSANAGLPPAEQARQKQLAGLREEVASLKAGIAQKETQEKQLRDKAAQYQAKVDQAPLRDAELIELTREYNTVNDIYQGLLARRETAAMSVDLNRRQMGEQFILIDSAQVPQKPVSPDRLIINIFGLAGGLALGLALVAFLEYRDNTFKTDAELAGLLSLPVLAVVPLMQSDTERRAQFRRRLILNLGLGSAVAVCLAVLGYSFVFLR
jgi:polysaccharide chain length determinant protein (PEP-CTERM system associated)